MLIKNGNVFIDGAFRKCDVAFDTVIRQVGALDGPADIDAEGLYVTPGFIDVHTHGAKNRDFSDGDPEGVTAASSFYADHGVTSFTATTMTLTEDVLTPAMKAIGSFRRPADGAKCAGIHLEGPFLSYAKRGAQDPRNLHKPDAEMFKRLNGASGGIVRLVTVAPEEDGAEAFIKEVSKICTVSLGHSVADYDTAMRAYEWGASHATHLFNGMNGFVHRAPGIVGAAADSGVTVELICDGQHIHPCVVRCVHKLFGDKLCIISDSLRCAGMPDGDYDLAGQPIIMKDGLARLLDGTIAGSSTNIHDSIRNVVRFGIPLEAAVTAATSVPAGVIRRSNEIGTIRTGLAADFVLMDRELNIKGVIVDGVRIR